MAVKILTDTGCDLPQDILDEYNIDMLPIIVIKDDKEFLDRLTIQSKDLLKNMGLGQVYRTAQIPPRVFEEKFEEYAKTGEDVIYIAFSSGLSSTYETSVLVLDSLKESHPEIKIDIVDTRAASLGMGLMVYKAGQMAKEGKSKEEILNMLSFYIKHMEHIVTVDDIEYLFRGGRVTRTQAFMGGLLNIKPVLDMDGDGKLQAIEKVRGRKKVLSRMVEIMDERGKNANLKNQIIGINHGNDLDGALKLKEIIEKEFASTEFIINIIGCAIGAHSGPGTLALFFLNKAYNE